MNTPICDFVEKYAKSEALRLHMPGHKGVGGMGVEGLDITEIEGADVLYSATGIIAESEENASSLFGSERTLYSTEGSSLSIRAMLYLALLWGQSEGRGRTVIAGRNAHRVFHSAAALLDLDVEWLTGEGGGLMACPITPEELDRVLAATGERAFAVYLTSPDYLGNELDIKGLSDVAERYGVLCLVDNAHGAYLRFLSESRHPMDNGAHMCADSAHKTLPALTGAGYLHISPSAPRMLSDEAESAMALFASTSPSYLILQSLDRVNGYLADGYGERLCGFSEKVSLLKARLAAMGYHLLGSEPLKLTVDAKSYGYFGTEIAEHLLLSSIVCEHSDRDAVVLMLTPDLSDTELERIFEAFSSLEKRAEKKEKAPSVEMRGAVMSIREATFSRRERIPVKNALGRVLADMAVSCPPAIPIAVCGERIDENAIELFEYYGIDEVAVVVE